jgi:HAD superfamily hydrolase (TIGR01509 family)
MVTLACIFDMDGVLIDSGAHHRSAWQTLAKELGVRPADPEFWRLGIGRRSEDALPLILGRPIGEAELRGLARRKRELYADFSRHGTQAVGGVVEFVGALARQGVPRAVGTSATRPDVDALLGELGLLDRFDAVVTAEDVTRGKPDPQVYLEAARRLRVEPTRCLVFEDSTSGIAAARAAGMRAVGVTTSYPAAELIGAGAESALADFRGVEWTSFVRR